MATSRNTTQQRVPQNRVPAARAAGAPKPTRAQVEAHARVLRRRRALVALTLVALVVGGTAAFTALVWPGFAIAEPVEPTPIAALARPTQLRFTPEQRIGEQTALVAAVPDVAGVWVRQGISSYLTWQNDDAVEAWAVKYLDGTPTKPAAPSYFSDDEGYPDNASPAAAASSLAHDEASVEDDNPAVELRLIIGQWPTPAAAASFMTAQTKGLGDPLLTGELTVANLAEAQGKYLIFDSVPELDVAAFASQTAATAGTPVRSGALADDELFGDLPATIGTMWWRNGTVVIRAVGPINLLAEFYSAFPL